MAQIRISGAKVVDDEMHAYSTAYLA